MCLLHDSSPEKLSVWEGRSYMDTSNYNTRNVGHRVLLEFRGENPCGRLGWTGPPQWRVRRSRQGDDWDEVHRGRSGLK